MSKLQVFVNIEVSSGLNLPGYQRCSSKKQHIWTPFSTASIKCEMQIKTSVSELNRDMQNNKMGSLETLGNIISKTSI